jgi:hypothetical protein
MKDKAYHFSFEQQFFRRKMPTRTKFLLLIFGKRTRFFLLCEFDVVRMLLEGLGVI